MGFWKSMENDNNKSPHILNASSNLLGLCFVVLTSLKLLNISHKTIIDELTTCAIVLFMTSCLLSFLSIRGNGRGRYYENIADFVFLGGIVLLFITTLLISFNIITWGYNCNLFLAVFNLKEKQQAWGFEKVAKTLSTGFLTAVQIKYNSFLLLLEFWNIIKTLILSDLQ